MNGVPARVYSLKSNSKDQKPIMVWITHFIKWFKRNNSLLNTTFQVYYHGGGYAFGVSLFDTKKNKIKSHY